MKIHILSDLHNEFSKYTPSLAAGEADLIVLAGDIDVKCRGVDWARKAFGDYVKVAYVAGNHEFYGGHLGITLDKMRAASCSRVRVLENEEWILKEQGVRILGATCWTDYTSTGNSRLAKWDASQTMSDFKKIRVAGYRKVQTSDVVLRNHVSLAWLRERLAEPFEGTTLVIMHHAPSMLSIDSLKAEKYETHIDASYANDWDNLLGDNCAYFIHGHTHTAVDYMIGNSRVICNPRGYPGEETGFNPDLLISVGN